VAAMADSGHGTEGLATLSGVSVAAMADSGHGTEGLATMSGVSVAAMADSRAWDRRSIYLVRSVCGRHGRLQGPGQKVNLPC
jgi:hypothetical protein